MPPINSVHLLAPAPALVNNDEDWDPPALASRRYFVALLCFLPPFCSYFRLSSFFMRSLLFLLMFLVFWSSFSLDIFFSNFLIF
jgi:hypothetical protein